MTPKALEFPDRRRALLVAALGFVQFLPSAPSLRALHVWLDSWSGLGHVVVGMERQGHELTRQDRW